MSVKRFDDFTVGGHHGQNFREEVETSEEDARAERRRGGIEGTRVGAEEGLRDERTQSIDDHGADRFANDSSVSEGKMTGIDSADAKFPQVIP